MLVLALLLAPACGDDDGSGADAPDSTPGSQTSTPGTETSTTTMAPEDQATEIVVENGSVEGGVQRLSVGLGETFTLRVRADTSDEVHVHGYDVTQPVTPDRPAEVTLTADIPGIFEVELEDSGLQIAELEVS